MGTTHTRYASAFKTLKSGFKPRPQVQIEHNPRNRERSTTLLIADHLFHSTQTSATCGTKHTEKTTLTRRGSAVPSNEKPDSIPA